MLNAHEFIENHFINSKDRIENKQFDLEAKLIEELVAIKRISRLLTK
jgi:hypothetical protein